MTACLVVLTLHLNSRRRIMKFIGVIGAGKCNKEEYNLAYEIGKIIAENKKIVVCGGLFGVMEACCKGAKEFNGQTIGILPGYSIDDCNKYVDIPIATGMGHSRNIIIASTSELLIAVGGEYGTLSEISIALKLGKKVLSLKSWEIKGITEIKHLNEINDFF